jgi:hypothetical protein
MATEKQTAAAHNAAQHSTGPTSPAGKEAVSYNRITHGLCSKKVILPGEDPEAFHALLNGYMSDLKPVDLIERTIVQQIAESYWRLDRARGLESGTFEVEARNVRANLVKEGKNVDLCGPDELYSLVIRNLGPQFELMRRYESTIERAYYRAIKEFHAYRATRLKQQPQSPADKKRFESQYAFRPAHFPGERPLAQATSVGTSSPAPETDAKRSPESLPHGSQ